MNVRVRPLAIGLLFLLLAVVPSLLSAAPIVLNADGTKSQTVQGVTVTTPQTYAYCVDASITDDVFIDNPLGHLVAGQIVVQYIVPGGRVLVQNYPVNTTGSVIVTVSYPKPSLWPYANLSNTTREIHVDVQLEVWVNGQNFPIGGADPGDPVQEGLGWDVYCIDVLPPPPPPPSAQYGCTPGYWKNHTERWASLTGTTLSSLYPASANYGLGGSTLLQSLSFRGGRGTLGSAYILLRAAAAAYLNSLPQYNLNYPLTTAQITSAVNAALASNDRGTMISLAALLDIANNLGCPLN
jgi:hypothetical protein